jgi:dTDP-glucose pyrophosphorylase
MTLLVLAAGIGSRYGGLKQMDGFGPNNETILEYSVFDALRAGFTDFVFVIRKAIEADFRSRILDKLPRNTRVTLCFQELEMLPEGFHVLGGRQKPWGTGHAVWVARNIIESPFALVNGDDFYGRKGFESIANYFRDRKDIHDQSERHAMVAYQLDQTLSPHGSVCRGLCDINESGELVGLEEILNIRRTEGRLIGESACNPFEIPEKAPVSMNLFGFYPEIFRALERDMIEFMKHHGSELKSEFYIPAVVNRLIEKKESVVDVLRTDENWLGVTNTEDKAYVVEGIRRLVNNGVYPTPLWS